MSSTSSQASCLASYYMYVEGGGCNYKGMKIQENQKQGFVSGEQLRNIWCDKYLRAWKWRNAEEEAGRGMRVKYTKCSRKDTVVDKKIGEEC